MKVDKKVPEIRFKGFSGEWRNTELAELALFNPKEELPVSFKYVDLESVKGTSLIGYKEELKENAPSRAQRLAKKSDVFFQTVRPYQKNNYLFNKDEIDFVFSTGYAQLRPYYDSDFLLNLIQRDPFVKDVLDNCTGTSYPAINASILASLEVSYPESKEEQTAIGKYFQKLDSLINQHQQKHDKLCNIKKAMLEKMFPKQGETIPEIRFKGFSGEWEERAICDLFTVTRGNVLAATKTSPVPTPDKCFPVYSSQTKNNGLMGFYDRYLFESAITWTTDGANAGTVNFREGKFYSTNVNGVLLSDEGYANKAVAEILNKEAWKHVSHVGNPKLMNNVMSAIKITVPNSAEEQTAIGNTFQKLDALINQHQQQITKLNNIKQACLSKMFV
ncbi:restriction endonuclease subunit S [Shewanella baltica]|uniref:restriction endonuclease subunit S n=1 Tax=Shewanella baltica TaxID=62322 RepID=UPI0002113174|nr:restriction endonuclease subunit S [Shewanella baltica]AEH16439.1 restriction modification system DNA specificity domain protein [Shewanella baltica OS117]